MCKPKPKKIKKKIQIPVHPVQNIMFRSGPSPKKKTNFGSPDQPVRSGPILDRCTSLGVISIFQIQW